MDATAGSCTGSSGSYGAAEFADVNFSLMTEEDGNGTDTLLNMASGTVLSGNCFIHNFPIGGTFTNTLNGLLACQWYLGPTGNQITLDARTFNSRNEQVNLTSDGASIDSTFGFARNNISVIDDMISDVGSSGDCFNGSNQGDFCIRDNNTSNVMSLSVGTVSSLQLTNTGIKSTQGLEIFNVLLGSSPGCTTSASVGSTCTTSALSLPAKAPDLNYRVVCVGKAPTGVPVITATTNSSVSAFQITIAALTASAASFASADCYAGHN
jgi:hypothetical protein